MILPRKFSISKNFKDKDLYKELMLDEIKCEILRITKKIQEFDCSKYR